MKHELYNREENYNLLRDSVSQIDKCIEALHGKPGDDMEQILNPLETVSYSLKQYIISEYK